MNDPDELLIERYKTGDPEALTELFVRYQQRMFNFALRFTGKRADAEDAVSETFELLITRKEAYRPIAKFSTWLYTVLRNKCISRIRQRKFLWTEWFRAEENEEDPIQNIPDPAGLASQQLDEKDLSERVRKAVERLPIRQKEAILLREYEKLDYQEISQVMDCSLENVKILIFRARGNLKQWLSPMTEENR